MADREPTAFEMTLPGKVLFGAGTFSRVGLLARDMGRAALVVCNGSDVGGGGIADRLAELLGRQHVRGTFVRQRGEPEISDVTWHVERARQEGCDMVIGLGGGSAIDAAKAVAGLLTNGGNPLDYLEVIGKGQPLAQPAAPWLAVPTTAGTGAEATRNAVLADRHKHFKASLRSENLLARAALIDPELAVDVPPPVTARAGMDALCQLIEGYTSRRAHALTDGLAIEGIARAAGSLERAVADGSDVHARGEMALAALASGIVLNSAGLGAAHGFAAPIGAMYPAPHGTVCGALLPGVMAGNVRALRAGGDASDQQAADCLGRYARVGRALTSRADLTDADAVDAGIETVARLSKDLRIARLGEFGLSADDVPGVVEKARQSSSMRYNPVTLTDEALEQILREAI